jgi:transcriptional regulator with GAF, ATPase, and Fis domain
VKVNCESIPNELFESEFFGHVKGSFTGALRDRAGRRWGTLFLDEAGEFPLALQGKSLRVLQEGEFERVGEERPRSSVPAPRLTRTRTMRHETTVGFFEAAL